MRDEDPQKILNMVEQSFAILLGCQATVLLKISPDLQNYIGKIGDSNI